MAMACSEKQSILGWPLQEEVLENWDPELEQQHTRIEILIINHIWEILNSLAVPWHRHHWVSSHEVMVMTTGSHWGCPDRCHGCIWPVLPAAKMMFYLRFPSTWSKATCCGICGLLFQFLCQLHDSLILGPLLTLSDVIREGHAVVRTGLWLSVSVTKRCENNQGYLSISKCTVWSWCKNPRSRAWKIQPNLFFKTESTPAILRRIHKYHQIWWNICLWLSTCRSKKKQTPGRLWNKGPVSWRVRAVERLATWYSASAPQRRSQPLFQSKKHPFGFNI